MIHLMTSTDTRKISKAQAASILAQSAIASVSSATSVGRAIEYTVTTATGDRFWLTATTDAEQDLIDRTATR